MLLSGVFMQTVVRRHITAHDEAYIYVFFFFLQTQWTCVMTSVDINVFPKQTLELWERGGGSGLFRPLCML